MPRKRARSITVYFNDDEFDDFLGAHQEYGPHMAVGGYARSILTGVTPHPRYLGSARALTQDLLDRLHSLDMLQHYLASCTAMFTLEISSNQNVLQNKEAYFGLEAEMRGYWYDEQTKTKTPYRQSSTTNVER